MEIKIDYLKEKLKEDLIAMGFDEDSLDIGIDALNESINDSLPFLKTAIDEGDYEKIRFYAHALKGTFSNFENVEFKNLSEFFKKIEYEAKEDKSIEKIKNYFNEIKDLSKNWLKIS